MTRRRLVFWLLGIVGLGWLCRSQPFTWLVERMESKPGTQTEAEFIERTSPMKMRLKVMLAVWRDQAVVFRCRIKGGDIGPLKPGQPTLITACYIGPGPEGFGLRVGHPSPVQMTPGLKVGHVDPPEQSWPEVGHFPPTWGMPGHRWLDDPRN